MLASLNPICLKREEPRATSDCGITTDDLQTQPTTEAHGSRTRDVAPGNAILLQGSLKSENCPIALLIPQ